jgi:hypothetical protein
LSDLVDGDASDADVRDEIARLEAQIEKLADTIEGCRKLGLIAKTAAMGGGLAMLALMLGFLYFDLAVFSAATAALLGGIVVSGSNSSTAQQAKAKVKEAEARRAALIDRLKLQDAPTLH